MTIRKKQDTTLLSAKVKRELNKRKKLASYTDSFESFGCEQLKIITKDSSKGFVPFEMNQPQVLIHNQIEKQRSSTGMVRAIILKARQQGISTYGAGRAYWRTTHRPYTSTVVLAHDSNTSDQLFNMTRNFISSQPENMRPKFSKSTGKELKYQENNSSYRVYTAGSPEAGRGTTPTILHCSEVAFWQHDEKILAGLFQGVARSEGTEIILESTANGAKGEFYRLWEDAVAGANEFIPIFIPWFLSDEYYIEPNKSFERTHEEDEYAALHSLSDGQIFWRRMKIAQSGTETFRQEYPATADEAFLTSGSNVFELDKLQMQHVSKPKRVEEYDPLNYVFTESGHGSLEYWSTPTFEGKYVIGVDVSTGVGQDYSSAVVMTPDKDVVALYNNNRIDPGTFGEMLFYLGRRFNNCLIVCERNGPGIATLQELTRMGYPNIYFQTKINQISKEPTINPGFQTTGANKPAIIGNLKRVVGDVDIKIPSNVILNEMKNYISLENGKMEAASGKHDDTVIATALCLEGLRTHGDKLSGAVDWSKFKTNPLEQTTWI